MTDDFLKGLSPIMRRAYEALSSDDEREDFLKESKELHNSAIRNGIAAIMARNQSHGVGTHICRIKDS